MSTASSKLTMYALGLVTGHALSAAHVAQTEAKLARAREALKWTAPYAAGMDWNGNAHERAVAAWRETA